MHLHVAWDQVAAFLVALGLVAGVLNRKVVRPFRRTNKALGLFLADWNGEEARPGVRKRAGVMETLEDHRRRLSTLERDRAHATALREGRL